MASPSRRLDAGADVVGTRQRLRLDRRMAHRPRPTFHGAREILEDPSWSGRLEWLDRSGFKRSSHRPDLIGFTPNGGRFAIEVELASKSKTRLDTILRLHQTWIIRGRTGGVIYICRDDDGCRRIAQAGDRVGLYSTSKGIRIETLDTIKTQTRAAYEQSRPTTEPAAA